MSSTSIVYHRSHLVFSFADAEMSEYNVGCFRNSFGPDIRQNPDSDPDIRQNPDPDIRQNPDPDPDIRQNPDPDPDIRQNPDHLI